MRPTCAGRVERRKPSPPLVSIVINNFNYGRFLPTAIDSALGQTYGRAETIVVDDGSTDESRQVIAGFGARVRAVLKENGGQASALNAGFAASRGDVVIFLDADDALCPAAAERCVPLFSSPEIVKVHWPLWHIDADGRPSGARVPDRELTDADFRESVLEHGPDVFGLPPASPPTSGNAWSRRFLEEVLPMPEAVFRRAADSYLLNMAALAGVTRAIPEPLGYYRVHGSNDTLKPLVQYASEFLPRHEECRKGFAAFLHRRGITASPEGWRRDTWYHRIVAAASDIRRAVPLGAGFVLIADGDWHRGELAPGRRQIPFLEQDGRWWGFPPNDSVALSELNRLHKEGAAYAVVVWSARWCFDVYPAMAGYILQNCNAIASNRHVQIFRFYDGSG